MLVYRPLMQYDGLGSMTVVNKKDINENSQIRVGQSDANVIISFPEELIPYTNQLGQAVTGRRYLIIQAQLDDDGDPRIEIVDSRNEVQELAVDFISYGRVDNLFVQAGYITNDEMMQVIEQRTVRESIRNREERHKLFLKLKAEFEGGEQ